MIMLEGLPPYWLIGILGLLIGLGLGSIFTYLMLGRGSRSRHLQLELDRLKENFQDYRDQVTHHFMRTSELVQEMTYSYRSVYEHLASGAQRLCGDAYNPALGHPADRRLATDTAVEEPAVEDVAYDEYAELTRIRDDIEELLGEGPRQAENDMPAGNEDSRPRQH